MPAGFRIVYDEDGYPRELDGEAAWARAIRSGSLTAETQVTVYARGEAPRLCRAGTIPELAEALGIAAPPPPPPPPAQPRAAPPPPSPPPAPPVPAAPRPPAQAPFIPAAHAAAHGTAREAPPTPPPAPVAPRQDNKALWISIAVAGLLLLVLFAATSQQPKTTPVAVPDTDMLFENDMASVPPTTAPEKIEEEEPAGYRASFDCSRASDEIERTICSDAGLAAQDRELADLYRQRLRAAAGLDASDLRASQAAWRDARRRCDDPVSARSCLAQLYSERLTALHADTGAASRDDEGEEMAETPPPPPFESAAPAAAARRAELRSGYISDDDYPASALRANASGTTVVQYTIGVDGRVVDCIVTDSSLNSALDSASCSIVQRRFRFRPAMDAGGKPIEEVRTQRILWRLPAD